MPLHMRHMEHIVLGLGTSFCTKKAAKFRVIGGIYVSHVSHVSPSVFIRWTLQARLLRRNASPPTGRSLASRKVAPRLRAVAGPPRRGPAATSRMPCYSGSRPARWIRSAVVNGSEYSRLRASSKEPSASVSSSAWERIRPRPRVGSPVGAGSSSPAHTTAERTRSSHASNEPIRGAECLGRPAT